jgi:pyrimidine-nucleoside phosphorylase
MQVLDIISKKRDGIALETEEINWLVEQYTQEHIPDYQMSSWLMAVCCRGMDARETRDLTLAMTHSGDQLHLRDLVSPVIDKHSTGGVGDKVTIALTPLVAACGLAVGKMTGRGLGYTGGTVDKLESIRGFRASLSREEFLRIFKQHHLVLAGQSNELAPADGKMYALRDVTATVESVALIASSIMSKKLAVGASHLLLDIKFGSRVSLKTVEQARPLAQMMVDIGRLAGIHTVAAITSMLQPLGNAVGNALEVMEAIAILCGEGPKDVSDLCYSEAAELLVMTGKVQSVSDAEQMVQHAIRSGAALEKLAEVIAAQDGDPRQIEQPHLLPSAPVRVMLNAPRSGYIAGIHSERIGLASMRLGAGRFQKGDQIDHSTGLVLQAKVGEHRNVGEPLVEIHARNPSEAEAIRQDLLACYSWSESPMDVGSLVQAIIHPD